MVGQANGQIIRPGVVLHTVTVYGLARVDPFPLSIAQGGALCSAAELFLEPS